MNTHTSRWLILAAIAALLAVTATCNSSHKPVEVSRLAILVTGHTQGYIANCGCALGQYGGLKRMARLVREECASACKPHPTDKGRPAEALLIDIGNFTDYSSDVSRITSAGVVRGMATMDYSAVGLGLYELAYPQQELWELLGESGLPLTAANLRFVPPPAGADHSGEINELIAPYKVALLPSGYRVRVIHVVDEKVADIIGNLNGYELADAAAAARKILDEHGSEADYWLLTIASASQRGTSADQIAALTELLLVVGFGDMNPLATEETEQVVFPHFIRGPLTKAKEVIRIETYFKQNNTPPVILYRQMGIPDTINSDEKIDEIIADIAPALERLEIEKAEEAMKQDIHPLYVGFESCRGCHAEIVEQLAQSSHTHALESLVQKQQASSAACLPCHVVGNSSLPGVAWSGGWNIIDQPDEMEGVHCESCHGPGEYHVQLMQSFMGGGALPPETQASLSGEGRTDLGLLPASATTCLVCHDTLNSPDFDFDKYWPKIEH